MQRTGWKTILLVLIAAGLFLSPLAGAHAAGDTGHHSAPQSHEAHHDGRPDGGNAPHEHSALHCCALSCTLTFSGALHTVSPGPKYAKTGEIFFIASVMLRSLYLDSDPPVPKS